MSEPFSSFPSTTVRDDGFDPVFYARHYPDVAGIEHRLDPWAHCRDWGRVEGRLPRPAAVE